MAREVTTDGNRTELRSGFVLRNYVTSLSELELEFGIVDSITGLIFCFTLKKKINFQVKYMYL